MKIQNARAQATNPGVVGSWGSYEIKTVTNEQADRLLQLPGFRRVDDDGKPIKSAGHGAIAAPSNRPAHKVRPMETKQGLDDFFTRNTLYDIALEERLEVSKSISKKDLIDLLHGKIQVSEVAA